MLLLTIHMYVHFVQNDDDRVELLYVCITCGYASKNKQCKFTCT